MCSLPTSGRVFGLLGLLVLLVAGCDDRQQTPVDPPHVTADEPVELTQQPFYYHQGEPVYLTPDPSQVVVASDAGPPEELINSVVTPLGLAVSSSRALDFPDHYLVGLSGTLSNGGAAIDALRERAGVRFAVPAYTWQGKGPILFVDQLVVEFKEGADQASIDSLITGVGAEVIRPPQPTFGFVQYRLSYPPGVDPLEVAATIYEHPLVNWADPDNMALVRTANSPTDPHYPLQYYFKNDANPGVDINIEPAWEMTLGGGVPSTGGVRVAVLDQGVEADHPDFGDRISTSLAYDAVDGNHQYASEPECSADGHGTNAAGIIAAQHSNGEGLAGGAPDVYVIPVRIDTDCGSFPTAADVADGIIWAWYYTDSDVLSNSWVWGAGPEPAITDAINDAASQGRDGKGAVVVFGAGNCSDRSQGVYCQVEYPAYLSSVLAVGAIDRDGLPAEYTPRDWDLDLVALSGREAHQFNCDTRGDVVTTELTGNWGCNDGPNGEADYTENFTGTSATAPQVAAAAVLVISLDQSMLGSDVRSRILDTSDYWGDPQDFGAGKLNVGAALELSVEIAGPSSVGQEETCTWTADAAGGDPSYSYEWYRDNSFVGTGDEYTAGTGTSDFLLRVDVTDQQGTIRSDDLYVTVEGEPLCEA